MGHPEHYALHPDSLTLSHFNWTVRVVLFEEGDDVTRLTLIT